MPTDSLPVDTFRNTYDLPPDAADRILMETARTVLGIETLLEIKVAELSQAVQRLAETDVTLATEMCNRFNEGTSRLDANHQALVQAQDALINYSAPINELESVIKSLSDLVRTLSAIRTSVSEAETRLQDSSKIQHEEMLATGNRYQDETFQRINTTASATQEAITRAETRLEDSSRVRHETMLATGKNHHKEALQCINTVGKSTYDAISATQKSLTTQTKLSESVIDRKITLTESTISKRLQVACENLSQQNIGINNGLIQKVDNVYEAALINLDERFSYISDEQHSNFIFLKNMLIFLIFSVFLF